jgi:uncharacterized membrane protein
MKWMRWWWLVIPAALTAWVVEDAIQSLQWLIAQQIDKVGDRVFAESIARFALQIIVWLYAIVASTVALARRPTKPGT